MKKQIFLLLLILSTAKIFAAQIELFSPDKKVNISVKLTDKIYYSVKVNRDAILTNAFLQLNLEQSTLGANPKLLRKTILSVNTSSNPIVPLKNKSVFNHYNLLRMHFKGDFSVEFRAYDDGIAYRFITSKKDSIIIRDEDVHIPFNSTPKATYLETGSFKTAYEIQYRQSELRKMDRSKMSVLPILFDTGKYKVLFSENDLYDYPCLYVKIADATTIDATFPKLPLSYGEDGDRSRKILKEANYIAKTAGKRNFPWRFLVISDKDEKLAANEMVYKLSTPNQLSDTKWIKPGQVTWEWWHNAYVYGVDFKSGYNQDTYKYYIDFASKFGIPYIIMDEGWAKTTLNPYEPNSTINLQELIAYGRQKNVKIVLWFTWLAVENNFNIFQKLEKWGIAGVKIDFMDRSDQWMVNFYSRVAKKAAKHHILVDFHGSFKPAGLEVAYPNVLSYEGVIGMEQNIGGGLATPNNNLFLPFLRNAVGPMDYTPGAMRSAHKKDYKPSWVNTMSIGTRAHQLAMYVVFESGFQMLADNPFNYLREPETTSFITSIPVIWDQTLVLDGKVGEYIVKAKRKDKRWFIGAMANDQTHELDIETSFLTPGSSYQITLIQDGINADFQAMDFKRIIKTIKGGDALNIKMVKDGGYVAVIEPLVQK